ncbi:cytochrome P450 [Colletotrichum graminicola]|uniref:Cytochrome P450 n=1 Tax=Colletotrichum graminicola (strain M1.001 / M2 / FGSC 10212) TaxID=645133 RepID=E3Q4J7_COLGM|nr:cytochrome P450 [Colletotrichum graminicola M1.001]EFQ26012.1 cytochrome P450 [Colletotrichum graminicola M1.001]WDK23140.1 cytochrome P450 [Colletotrichum graminicola]
MLSFSRVDISSFISSGISGVAVLDRTNLSNILHSASGTLEFLKGVDTSHLVAYGAGAVAVHYVVSSFATWQPLRHVPGPFLGSFSYLWLIRNNFLGISSAQLVGLKKYGSVVHVAPNYVLTDDPAALRRISGARSAYGRDAWWTALRIDPRQDNMLTTTDTAAHDRLKAQTSMAYSGRDNVDIEGGIDIQLAKLKDTIRQHYLSTPTEMRKADLVWIIRYFTMDSITFLAYGEPFGYLKANEDLFGFNRQVQNFTKPMSIVVDTPILRNFVKSPLAPHFMPKTTDKEGMGRPIALGQEFVGSHFDTDFKDAKGMVGSFMRHGLTREQCEAECVVQVIAGADTTGTTIRSALMLVTSTPRVYSRFVEEIKSAVDSGLVSSSTTITYEQGKKLPYLQAVIYEAIRVRPPGLYYGHFKSVPPGGDTVDGVFLPGSTAISRSLIGMMMSTEIFGSDAEIFRPERFLEVDAAKRVELERVVELAFGHGRWMCAGKHVAFTQLTKAIFELLRAFEFQTICPSKPWKEESGIFWNQTDMLVRITERRQDL